MKLISDKPQSLKEFTENNYAQAAFFWNTLLRNKEIKVNGKRIGADVRLMEGDEVCYYLTPKQAEKPAFHILYEDENVLIADKESGVNSAWVHIILSTDWIEIRKVCLPLQRTRLWNARSCKPSRKNAWKRNTKRCVGGVLRTKKPCSRRI